MKIFGREAHNIFLIQRELTIGEVKKSILKGGYFPMSARQETGKMLDTTLRSFGAIQLKWDAQQPHPEGLTFLFAAIIHQVII